jgi:hypothetical protein
MNMFLPPRSDEISTAFGFHGNDKLTRAALLQTNYIGISGLKMLKHLTRQNFKLSVSLVTTAWRVLVLRMETAADSGWSSSLGVGRGDNNSSSEKIILLGKVT